MAAPERPGSRPSASPLTLAKSSTRSIRPRSRDAVSLLVCQMGVRTSSTSSVVICETRFERIAVQ